MNGRQDNDSSIKDDLHFADQSKQVVFIFFSHYFVYFVWY